MNKGALIGSKKSEDDEWISVSDMMAGLMMIFLFISIFYIQNISNYFENVSEERDEICSDLEREFHEDAQKWDMSICESGLLITFQNDSNFETDSAELSTQFKKILSEFFPRLMSVVLKHSESISELRIEGHTDSSIRRGDTQLSGYLYNTKLSQERSRNVMSYSLNLSEIVANQSLMEWTYSHVTAHGMSSSNRIFDEGDTENFDASRRVEFRIRTSAEDSLLNLVSELRSDEN
ncbi:MAG: OmpA family protein [Gammaproteobacteria bacterium AqS3]|nr:OmpA family protein [Gammaproteobacteria bacterium AqS3]